MRPTSDVMGVLSARLPAPMAIAAYQALRCAAITKQASGDPRSLNGLMADELYERLTGRSVVDGIDVEVGLVITDAALFAGTSDPAELLGYGPIPAELARELLRPHEGRAEHDSRPDSEPTARPEPRSQHDRPDHSADESSHDEESDPADQGDPAGGPDQDDEGSLSGELTREEIIARARADAAANANGFAGGRAPEGHCPRGGRCVDFSCTLIHGAPATSVELSPKPPQTQRFLPPPSGAPVPAGPPSGVSPLGAPPPGVPPAGVPSPSPAPGSSERSSPPAGIARAAKAWIRRLFTDPQTGVLTARDPRKRLFTGELRAFLVARDRTCRNTWCGAPIRTVDHIERHADGGLTTKDNGQGLCERCNLARERARHRAPEARDYRPPPPKLDTLPRRPTAGSEATSRPYAPDGDRAGRSDSDAEPAQGGSDPAGP